MDVSFPVIYFRWSEIRPPMTSLHFFQYEGLETVRLPKKLSEIDEMHQAVLSPLLNR